MVNGRCFAVRDIERSFPKTTWGKDEYSIMQSLSGIKCQKPLLVTLFCGYRNDFGDNELAIPVDEVIVIGDMGTVLKVAL